MAPNNAIAAWGNALLSVGMSASQVGRILADLDLKPRKVRGWLTRRDLDDPFQRVDRDRVADLADLMPRYLAGLRQSIGLSGGTEN